MRPSAPMWALAAGLAALLCVPGALAQQAPQPQSRPREQLITLTGRVLIGAGMREASGVHVQLLQGLGMPIHQTYTDSQGTFEFRALKRGMYIVQTQSEGYEEVQRSVDLSRMWGAAVRLTIVLQPEGSAAKPEAPSGATASVRELQIPDKARKAFQRGMRELDQENRPERSVPFFQEAIALYAQYDEAYVQLSLAYLDQGQPMAAQEALESALASNAQNARVLTFLGVVHRRLEQPEKAEQILREAVALPGADWLSHAEFAECLLQLGKIEEAGNHARRAHELNQQAVSVHMTLAGIAIRQKEFRPAIAHLEEMLSHSGANASAEIIQRQKRTLGPLAGAASAQPGALWQQTMDAARQAFDQQDYGLADHLLQAALAEARTFGEKDARQVATLSLSGSVYQEQKRHRAAEYAYTKALAILEETLEAGHPVVAITLNNLAEVYYLQGRHDQAEPLYQRALAMLEKTMGPAHPNVATALENYAALLRATGRVPEAKEMESRARSIRAQLARGAAPNR